MRNKTIMLSILAIILIVSSAMVITGCVTTGGTNANSTVTAQPAAGEKVLRVGEMWEIKSNLMDPAAGDGTFIDEKAGVVETLVGSNADFSLKPELATSWQQIDANTWVFNLRNDVLFHDGSKMTASDVKFSLERAVSMDSLLNKITKIASVEVINDSAIRITTSSENLMLPSDLHYSDAGIIAKSSLDANGNFSKPIATGPFKFSSYDEQTEVVTVLKNDKWWGGNVGLDKMILKGIPDPNTRAMAIENGDIDFTVDVPYSETDSIANMSGMVVQKYNTPRMYKLALNLKEDSLSDIRVRQAISDAIDRNSIATNVLYNVGTPAAGPFTSNMVWSNTSLAVPIRNVEKAKQLLTDAGWVDTNGDGIREKNGKPLSFTLMTYSSRPGLPPMGEAIAAELKDVGISVKPVTMDYGAITDKQKSGNWDMILAAFATTQVPDPGYILTNWYTTTGKDNPTGYSNPTYDNLIQRAVNTTDINQRYQLYKDAQYIVYNDQPQILVANYGCDIVMKDYVKGYKYDPTAHDYRINPDMTIQK